MVIDKNVAEAVKNFLKNYAEVHGLPSPDVIFLQVLNEMAR